MDYSKLIQDIKKGEGFRGDVYIDTEGYPTVGYGTKLPINEDEAMLLLEHRLKKIMNELNVMKLNKMQFLEDEAMLILYDMAYNLGVPKLMNFKKMWLALEDQNYSLAADEMVDSRWYKQTKSRAINLSDRMRALS